MSTSSIIFGEPQLAASAQPQTLVELLQLRALDQPEKVIYTFLADGEQEAITLTLSELDQRARAISAWLKPLGGTGRAGVALVPPGRGFHRAFFRLSVRGGGAGAGLPPAPQ